MRTRLVQIAAFICSLATTYAGPVDAHALFSEPAPRDQQDGYKDGSACGVGFAATQPLTTYAPGQSLNVQWLETVDHPGCFLVEFSAKGDQDFQVLGRKSHSNPPPPDAATSAEPRHWSLDVTLPMTPCSGCALRLRQLMLDADVAADACSATNAAPGSIYTTCANIALEGGGSAGSAAVTPTPGDNGCSVGPVRDVSLGHALALGSALGLLSLRRRKQRPSRRSAQA
jgi:hypothetical protein